MSEPIRLQKYLAESGVCSRREADALIQQGMVSVNQQTAVPGQKVVPGRDRVVVEGRVIKAVRRQEVTLLFHKPKGVSCQKQPPEGMKGYLDFVPKEHKSANLRPAGELDTASEGLVVLTTDGELFNKLVHPSGGVLKHYRASLEEPLPMTKIERLRKGFIHEGERIRAEEVTVLSRRGDGLVTDLDLATLHGRKLEVRRLFDFLRADLRRLKRVRIGGFEMKRVPKGLCRELTGAELKRMLEPGD